MAVRRAAGAALVSLGVATALFAGGLHLIGYYPGTNPYVVERIVTVPPLGVLLAVFVVGSMVAIFRRRRSVWAIAAGAGLLPLTLGESSQERGSDVVHGPALAVMAIGVLVTAAGLILLPQGAQYSGSTSSLGRP